MKSFNDFYYSFSPGIADYERENPVFKEAVECWNVFCSTCNGNS